MEDVVYKIHHRKLSGFTLVELLIVIIIIGVLAGFMMLAAQSAMDKAEATKIINNMITLKKAAALYKIDYGTWNVATYSHKSDDYDKATWLSEQYGDGSINKSQKLYYYWGGDKNTSGAIGPYIRFEIKNMTNNEGVKNTIAAMVSSRNIPLLNKFDAPVAKRDQWYKTAVKYGGGDTIYLLVSEY